MATGGNKKGYTPPVVPFWQGFAIDLSFQTMNNIITRLIAAPLERAKFLLQGQARLCCTLARHSGRHSPVTVSPQNRLRPNSAFHIFHFCNYVAY
jgi:hypothetical protein